tara:strand:+ start:351 stop:527 length:177 start_codon:yes stop_codon:yes gene_type:complete
MNKLKNSKILAALIIITMAVLFYINPKIVFVVGIIFVVVGFWYILSSFIEFIKEDRKL